MTWSCYRGCAVFLLLSITLVRGAPVMENEAPRKDNAGTAHDGMPRLLDPIRELNLETPQLPGEGDKEVQTRSLSRPNPARLSPKQQGGEEGEEEEELFKDIDPKTLAAVLIEALNQGGEREEEREGGKEGKEGGEEKGGEAMLALLGRQHQEEAMERRKEEERLTERVKSRTRSGQGGLEKEKPRGESSSWEKPMADPPSEEKEEEGEEKQGVLTEQEMENLEAKLREMQRHSLAVEKERERERERAAVASLGKGRGSWADSEEVRGELAAFMGLVQKGGENQEEEEEEAERERKAQQPRLHHPRFRSEEDEEEAELEAEEEAEQEEVRRQAAEAQRARDEEEKLADVASDLLLQYLTKQGGDAREQEREELEEGHSHSTNPNHRQGQRKKNYLLEDNAAEDKRSNEVEVRDEQDEDDIDPQTIDRLIEISSKLHLPADDVIDIITDVEEKKKKKDSAPELRRRPAPNPAPKPAFNHNLDQNPAGRAGSARAPPGRLQVELQRDFKHKAAPVKQQQYPKQQASMHKVNSLYYPRYQPARHSQELSVNDILGNSLDYEESWPAPWRYQAQQQQQPERESYPIPNYIQPRRPPPQPRRHFYYPAAPRGQQRGNYYQETRDNEEELENFIEKILLEHPEVFQ
ncbi:neurosecretory protein VGF-like [Polyodon spathula]|uniref:neurosecretory protein VGF-like n=1 Tax=Polyodon spathula TaxID=7913 RepID=UPI001B7E6F5F|nr:neurosecretory protein VGF-like [Polyodon spathula]